MSGISSTPNPKVTLPNLWHRASESLKNDSLPEKRDLIDRYFEIVKSELGSGDATLVDVADHLNQKVEELNQRKLTFSWGSQEANIKAVFNNTARHIITAKELITSAASSDPHAALACAGGLVLLTFLIRPVEQREELLGGLELTSSIVVKHAEFDPRRRIFNHPNYTDRFQLDLENTLVKLYARILEMQARALCYVQRNRASQFVRDMFRGSTWKTLIAEIKDLDARSREPETLAFQAKVHDFMDHASDARKQAQQEDLRRRISGILRTLDRCPYEDRKNINPERAPGTCEWFMQHHLFGEWAASDESSLLWVTADPGCGKSVLSKFLVDEVLTKGETVTCFFFFKEDFPDQREASLALCVMLWQLFTKKPFLMTEPIIKQFESGGSSLLASFSSLFKILLEVTSDSGVQVCFLLDALDECQESGRREFIEGLNKFYITRKETQSLKFIVTSRPELKIQRGFQRLENVWPQIHLRGEDDAQVAKISSEIETFARIRIGTISESLRLTTTEADFLRSEVMKVHSRTYLWVHMALNVIENMLQFTKATVQQVLQDIPEGLDRLYEKILARSHDVVKARKLLHVVLAAPRPLTLEEMSVALSITKANRYFEEVDLEPLDRFKDSVRAICGLFVTIVHGKIYLIHQTAKEFLLHKDDQAQVAQRKPSINEEPFVWRHTFSLPESHLILAQICMWHLNLRSDFILMQPLDQGEREHRQFFTYSACFWHEHFRNSEANDRSEIAEMAAELCIASCSDALNPWFLVWLFSLGYRKTPKANQTASMDQFGILQVPVRRGDLNPIDTYVPDSPNPCIVAATCGLETIVRDMVTKSPDLHLEVDELSRTPLWWAAREGHSEVVRFLLHTSPTAGSDQNSSYITANLFQDGMTPLIVASKLGHLSTVQVLLEDPRICPSVTNLYSQTALFHAMRYGRVRVAEALLTRNDALFNLTDIELWHHFRMSVNIGYRHVSELIAKGLPPEFEKRVGKSPILFVIEAYRGADKLSLLKALHRMRRFDIEIPDEEGRSAVWWAASSAMPSSAEVLEWLLLDISLDAESSDFRKQTPFSRAASQGNLINLDVLLRLGKVDVNSRDNLSCTPLMHALKKTQQERYWKSYGNMCNVVKFLLANGADPNLQDGEGRTALMYAAALGSLQVMKLLTYSGALVNIDNHSGQTALDVAHEADLRSSPWNSTSIVETLLGAGAVGRGDYSPDYNSFVSLFDSEEDEEDNCDDGSSSSLSESLLERIQSHSHDSLPLRIRRLS